MLVIILNLCNFKVRRWFIGLMSVISTIMFFIAASPGYLDIYYKAVSLEKVNGVTVLIKEYGEWHSLYLLYLMAFFAMMIMAIIHAAIKKKVSCVMNVVIPAVVVSVNIGVWLMEQLIRFDEVMSELNIKENTLKYHNKNIYSKLGVSSRKQLLQIAAVVKTQPDKTDRT